MCLISERGCKLASSPATSSVARVLIPDNVLRAFDIPRWIPVKGVSKVECGETMKRVRVPTNYCRRCPDCCIRPQPITVIGGD
jgi:hypothetical protein